MLFTTILVLLGTTAFAHTNGVYSYTNLPFRGAATSTSNTPASTDGPCGPAGTQWGSNGVTSVKPGQTMAIGLQYAQEHPSGGANTFQLAMVCGNNAVGTSVQPLAVSTNANSAQNRLQYSVIHLADTDLNPRSFAFTFPTHTPDGTTITSGDQCTVAMLDQRDWGACLDFQVDFPVNQVVGGVVTPIILIAMGAILFYFRSPIVGWTAGRVGPMPNPTKWRNINLALAIVTCLLAIIATASHVWSQGSSFHVGPWVSCPDTDDCTSTTASGLPEFYLVRLFSLLPVFILLGCVATPILVSKGMGEGPKSAKFQGIGFFVSAILSLTAFLIWVCVLNVGNTPGWGLFLELANFVILCAATVAGGVWYFHLGAPAGAAMAPKSTGPGGVDV